MPAITEDEKGAFSTFKCVYSNQCSKVTCIEATKDHKLTVGFEVNKCGQSLSGKVTLKQPDVLDWSHSLGDGEKAKLPAVPGSFSGDLKVSDASLFIKVGLQEMKGNKVNFTVRKPRGLMLKCLVTKNYPYSPYTEGLEFSGRGGGSVRPKI